jgi:hypothetical protein
VFSFLLKTMFKFRNTSVDMIRPLITISLLLMFSVTSWAQGTVYVRATGNDANDGLSESTAKKTLQSAAAAAQSGDIVDVGPGTFAGATLKKGLVIQGSNANYDIARWDAPTVITSTITLGQAAAGASVTLVGLQFGQITPLAGTAENANITVYNCKMLGSKPIVTTGTKWAELFLTASILDGKSEGAKPGSATATTAIVAGDVGVTVIRENVIRNYSKSAIDVAGAGQIIRVSYNEFTSCNSSADADHAAVRINASGIQEEILVENSLFTSCATSVSVAGTISGKTLAVQRNSFRRTPGEVAAIRNTSATTLEATCNAFNVPTKDKDQPLSAETIQASIKKLTAGAVTVNPTLADSSDSDGDAIGFEPVKTSDCRSTEQK